jgi:hypothetical protein
LLVGRNPGGVNPVLRQEHREVPLLEEAAQDLGVDPVVVDDEDLPYCFYGNNLAALAA